MPEKKGWAEILKWCQEQYLELVSDFQEAGRNFIFDFLPKRAAKYSKNHRL
jgi:hypothetical protein